ncbi:MAG: hypothetical protein A3C84_03905, partial [Candidatus Ryanbacteria bacterium RIFCSPHIGHO2_02_FULL_48_12]
QMVFAVYTAVCFITIPLLHWIETRVSRGIQRPRWSSILPIATQFALGGFWSGFIIFYGRSAVFGVSWPFLIFLFLVFLGSEYFHRYHARLVFTSTLFFFALYSYAIFALPIYAGAIGTMTFVGSGIAAVCIFALFTILLRLVGRERFIADVWRIRAGAFLVLVVINLSYFTNILPPLPLSMEYSGIYHSVWHIPGAYLARSEVNQSWQTRYLGFAPTLHVSYEDSLSAYGAVFAPTALTTTVVHRWQWYDPIKKEWIKKAAISYPIIGGRDGGYRGYSEIPIYDTGKWRVDVETADGRLIARLPFTVELTTASPIVETITLK